jgi:hypothetical protein
MGILKALTVALLATLFLTGPVVVNCPSKGTITRDGKFYFPDGKKQCFKFVVKPPVETRGGSITILSAGSGK